MWNITYCSFTWVKNTKVYLILFSLQYIIHIISPNHILPQHYFKNSKYYFIVLSSFICKINSFIVSKMKTKFILSLQQNRLNINIDEYLKWHPLWKKYLYITRTRKNSVINRTYWMQVSNILQHALYGPSRGVTLPVVSPVSSSLIWGSHYSWVCSAAQGFIAVCIRTFLVFWVKVCVWEVQHLKCWHSLLFQK